MHHDSAMLMAETEVWKSGRLPALTFFCVMILFDEQ